MPMLLVVLVALGYYIYSVSVPKPPAKPDATWARIVQQGVLRIGIDPSFPPFESDDGQGNLSGLDIALADAIVQDWSQQYGVPLKVEYVYTGFDGLYDALKAGQFDIILSALPYDPLKTQDVSFTHSYFNSGPVIIVREQDSKTHTYYDLAGKRVGVELGSTGDSFARKWQRRLQLTLKEYDLPEDALDALRQGEVDAVFADGVAFDDYVRTRGGVKKVGQPLVDELIVMAVRRNAPTLLQEINAVIDAMKRDGRLDKLQHEWF
jgi:ABC-type amino acid transport substrate-binding protein